MIGIKWLDILLLLGLMTWAAYRYVTLNDWVALAVFGGSITNIILIEIRYQFDKVKEAHSDDKP